MKKFDFGLYVGAFQPLTSVEVQAFEAASQWCRSLILIVGSSGRARSTTYPLHDGYRVEWMRHLKSQLGPLFPDGIHYFLLPDHLYVASQWQVSLLSHLGPMLIGQRGFLLNVNIESQAQPSKPNSTFLNGQYQALLDSPLPFSMMPSPIPAPQVAHHQLRDALFQSGLQSWEGHVPDWVLSSLKDWEHTAEFAELRSEFECTSAFKAQYLHNPYPPIFVTVDAALVVADHILLIERKHRPGKGLWALPGGFLDASETILNACLRELDEETQVKIDHQLLIDSIARQRTFDYPWRSARGRTITHAFVFLLERYRIPDVMAADDAKQARWFPLQEVRHTDFCEQMFEDHWDMIESLTQNLSLVLN